MMVMMMGIVSGWAESLREETQKSDVMCKRDTAINGFRFKRETAINGFTSKQDAAINGCRSKRDTAINGFRSKRDTAINGCRSKRDTAINECKSDVGIERQRARETSQDDRPARRKWRAIRPRRRASAPRVGAPARRALCGNSPTESASALPQRAEQPKRLPSALPAMGALLAMGDGRPDLALEPCAAGALRRRRPQKGT